MLQKLYRLAAKLIRNISKQIIHAQDGAEALEICRNNPKIDVVLMDIQLPKMNGYEATKIIRSFNKEIIIISQTAYALKTDREKAIECGCNDYIAKPIKKHDLLRMIAKYVKN